MSSLDPTVVIERMARRLRDDGAAHPVAAALALAARGHTRLPPHDFATHVGLDIDDLRSIESGAVAFGALPARLGPMAGATGADLLALADLAAGWQRHRPGKAAGS